MDTLKGCSSLQVLIDEKGNIVNNSYALDMMELLDEEEAEKDPPECFGNFYEYIAPKIVPTLDCSSKGAPITLSFNAFICKIPTGFDLPPTGFELPSPVTPPSPLPFSMEGSPPDLLSMPRFLSCTA